MVVVAEKAFETAIEAGLLERINASLGGKARLIPQPAERRRSYRA